MKHSEIDRLKIKKKGFSIVKKVRKKLKFQQAQPKESFSENTNDLLLQKEFKTALEGTIGSLSEAQREVFLMNRIDKLKYLEIADLLEISVKAVEKRMQKALTNLNELLKEYEISRI